MYDFTISFTFFWWSIWFHSGLMSSIFQHILCNIKLHLPVFLPFSSGSWLLSSKLARMLLIDCELNSNDCPLAISGIPSTISHSFLLVIWCSDICLFLIVRVSCIVLIWLALKVWLHENKSYFSQIFVNVMVVGCYLFCFFLPDF